MKVNFDMVRIGKVRGDYFAETILKENVELLKRSIQSSLENDKTCNSNNEISMVMIIPGRGYSIKVALQDIRENHIKDKLKLAFPKNIFKREYSIIMDNINNRIF